MSIVRIILTFFAVLMPYFLFNIFLEVKTNDRKICKKKYFNISIFLSLFFILLYQIYGKHDIIQVIKNLSGSFHVKFILVSYLLSFFILLLFIVFKNNGGILEVWSNKMPKTFLTSLLMFFLFTNIGFSLKIYYGIVPIEQFLFHLSFAKTVANYSIVRNGMIFVLIQTMVFYVLSVYALSAKIIIIGKIQSEISISFEKHNKIFIFLSILLPIAGFILLIYNIGLLQYIEYFNSTPNSFYEEHYIFPEQMIIDFPEKKRNLIVIFVEGLETGYLTIENGGAFTEDLIPEVALLAENNLNFSRNEDIGGAVQLYGTEWTIAGIVADYSGLPLAVHFLNQTDWNNYGSIIGSDFLPGASSVGEILYNEGYKNYFILGSDIVFGGRDKYFSTHKNTVIYDYNYFLNNNYIPEGYRVWWGIEDRKLYEFAKIKFSEISRNDEPFFITLLTADTHPTDGYLDDEAEIVFDSQFKNVIRDMSRQLYSFIEWLMQQDFYENTTIVILGDHLYQDSSFFPESFKIQRLSSRYEKKNFNDDATESYNRYPINIFINHLLNHPNAKNRTFSNFDLFPTIIESIGGTIDSEGLALGRSMLNGCTLLEKYGETDINRQLRGRSNLYDSLWR